MTEWNKNGRNNNKNTTMYKNNNVSNNISNYSTTITHMTGVSPFFITKSDMSLIFFLSKIKNNLRTTEPRISWKNEALDHDVTNIIQSIIRNTFRTLTSLIFCRKLTSALCPHQVKNVRTTEAYISWEIRTLSLGYRKKEQFYHLYLGVNTN